MAKRGAPRAGHALTVGHACAFTNFTPWRPPLEPAPLPSAGFGGRQRRFRVAVALGCAAWGDPESEGGTGVAVPRYLLLLGQLPSLRSNSSKSRTSVGAFCNGTFQPKGLETGGCKMGMVFTGMCVPILAAVRLWTGGSMNKWFCLQHGFAAQYSWTLILKPKVMSDKGLSKLRPRSGAKQSASK